MSPDVDADVTSTNSLSFAGMVCVQNQHLMPPKEQFHQLAHAEQASLEFEFKFGHAIPEKGYSVDISNGKLPKQAVVLAPNQSQTGKQTCSKSVAWQDQSNNGRSDRTESSQDRSTNKSNTRAKIAADKKCTSSGFSKKIFKSFAIPCRDCRTIEPTPSIKAKALQ